MTLTDHFGPFTGGGSPVVSPFRRSGWHGEIVAHGECDDGEFGDDDLLRVLAYHEDPSQWDGEVYGLVELRDGRFVAWVMTYHPTGDGFNADAYGGDADIHVATDLELLVRMGLTDEARRALDLEIDDDDDEDDASSLDEVTYELVAARGFVVDMSRGEDDDVLVTCARCGAWRVVPSSEDADEWTGAHREGICESHVLTVSNPGIKSRFMETTRETMVDHDNVSYNHGAERAFWNAWDGEFPDQ